MSTLGARKLLWANRLPAPVLDLNFLAPSPAFVGAWPLDGRITFTRATTGPATYFDATGTLQTARQNVLLNSGNLSSFAAGSDATAATAATIAPDGTLTGTSLTEDGVAGVAHYRDYSYTPPGNSAITFSVYMKNGTRRYNSLELRTAATWVGGVAVIFVDLQLGTITSTSGTVTGSITTVGNGWYRVSATATTTASPGATAFRIGLNNPANTNSYNGDGVSLNYFWGAQIEVAGSMGNYIPTGAAANSAPRFDFDPVTHAPLALLMEESRTNLILQSADLSISPWGAVALVVAAPTVTQNQLTAPDGTLTAAKIVYPQVVGAGAVSTVRQTVTVTAAVHTWSVWLRGAVGGEQLYVYAVNGATTLWYSQLVTLTTSWQRFSFTTPALTAASWNFAVGTDLRDGTQTTKAAQTIYAWGGQAELAAFGTSYIPTAGSTATRPVDGASMPTGAWWLTQIGTLVADAYVPIQQSRAAELCGWHNGATTKTSINIGGGNTINMFDSAGLNTGLGAQPIVPFKAGYAYQNGVQRGCVNGGAITTATQATLTTGETALGIGCDSVIGLQPDGYIRRIRYWPVPLSAVQLQKVTK